MAKQFFVAFCKVILVFAILGLAVEAFADDATHMTVRDGQTVGLQWTSPTDNPTHYSVTFQDVMTNLERTFVVSSWIPVDSLNSSTAPGQTFTLPVGTHKCLLYAWNDAGSSAPSEPIWLTVVQDVPNKPVGFQFILRVGQ